MVETWILILPKLSIVPVARNIFLAWENLKLPLTHASLADRYPTTLIPKKSTDGAALCQGKRLKPGPIV